MTELAIVLVGYNCADWIDRSLSSLPAALAGRAAEVVVVDNASHDATAEVVANLHSSVRLVRNTVNEGFARAVNRGVRATSARCVLLLNPDTECLPGSLNALLLFAEANPQYSVYGGRTLNEDGSVDPSSCWGLPTVWSSMCFALGLSTVFRNSRIFNPESLGRWQRDTVREVDMVTGCLLLVTRKTRDRLGGLDEKYFVYGEDADFSARAKALGLGRVITPDAEIIHAKGVSSHDSASLVSLMMAGRITYARAHFSPFAARLVEALLRLGVRLRALGSKATGHGTKWSVAWTARADWINGFPPCSTQPHN